SSEHEKIPIYHHWVASRVIGTLDSQEMTASGWSCKLEPTPGAPMRTSTPVSCRCSAGPIPESINSFGVSIAPADTMTSRLAINVTVLSNVLSKYSTPSARLFSLNKIRVTQWSVRIDRFLRSIIGCRYDTDEDERVPSLFELIWKKPAPLITVSPALY